MRNLFINILNTEDEEVYLNINHIMCIKEITEREVENDHILISLSNGQGIKTKTRPEIILMLIKEKEETPAYLEG